MPVFAVTIQYLETFEHTIKAETKEEAEKIGVKLVNDSDNARYDWYNSIVSEIPENDVVEDWIDNV